MLSAILATSDPDVAADEFVRLGWRLVFATPKASDDRLTCVALGDAQIMLGVDDPKFLGEAAREYQGAGVEFYVRLPEGVDLDLVYREHLEGGAVVDPLAKRPWGERAFHARICGYKFLITTERPSE